MVITLGQAVAAPMCTVRLADAGEGVITLEHSAARRAERGACP